MKSGGNINDKYSKNWNQFYRRTYRFQDKKALWDVDTKDAIEADFKLFKPYFDPALPIIDLGCGTGTQSVFLTDYYPKVLGVDVASEAITIAKDTNKHKNIQFDTLDVTDTHKALEIHTEIGDANIYMRGVLHQIIEEDLVLFGETIKTLLGQKGHLYFIEVADSIRDYFEHSKDDFSKLPEDIRNTFISNLPPKGLNVEKIDVFFPEQQFQVLSLGDDKLLTNIQFENTAPIYIPAVYGIVKNK